MSQTLSTEVGQQAAAFEALLGQLASGALRPAEFGAAARAQTALLAALPPRYAEVLDSLIDRLESSALFTEESCSFSAGELHASLVLWLGRARATLGQ